MRPYVSPCLRAGLAGATAFTAGEHVAFKAPPDLWLAAHVVSEESLFISDTTDKKLSPAKTARSANEAPKRRAPAPRHDWLALHGRIGNQGVLRLRQVRLRQLYNLSGSLEHRLPRKQRALTESTRLLNWGLAAQVGRCHTSRQ